MDRDELDDAIRLGCPLGPERCKWAVCAHRPDANSTLAEIMGIEPRCMHYRRALDAMQRHVAEQLTEHE